MTEPVAKNKNSIPDFLTYEGQLGELIRNYNWSATPLGPISQWSQSLKTTVNLMLNSANPIWIGWGTDVTFLYNDAYIEILGTEKHTWALGRPVSEVWEEVWDICGPLCKRVFEKGQASTNNDMEFYLKRGDFLEEKYFSFSYSPVFDESGNVGGLFCASYETTDKILSARRNRTLSALAEKSLTEKTIATACAAAAETLGKNPKDVPFAVFYLTNDKGEKAELVQRTGLGKPAESLFPENISLNDKNLREHYLPVAEVITSGKPVIAAVSAPGLLPHGPAGQPVQQVIAKPIMNSSAKTIGAIVFGINPTRKLDEDYHTFFKMAASQVSKAIQNATATENERKRLEELAEIDRAKTTFFSNISHEFRTPLTLMLGPLEDLMHHTPIDSKVRETAETAHRNAMRLLRLVNTLLDFSYMESGRMKAKFTPTDISQFTASLAGNFRAVIEKAGMDFIVDIPALVEAHLDRDMWEKIIFNLLSNAFKYTLKGKISISLSEESGNAVLRVTDTGVGIPQAELSKVFTRFHRIASASGRSFEGSGIGLSMIKEFVLQHNGNIWVESTEGKGSTFTVKIPLFQESSALTLAANVVSANNAVSLQYNHEAETTLQNNENFIEVTEEDNLTATDTILIVDDNKDMRHYLKSIMEKNYKVLLANNGQAALNMSENHDISLIITDLMMPAMDGLTLLKELKNRPRTSLIPVILLTARAGEESKIEGFETGADDYLVKPFSAKELQARIRSQIRIAKARGHIKQELNNLFMQAPMAICVLKGQDFIVEMANDNMLSLWKKDAAAILNKPLLDGLPEAKAQGHGKLLEQVMQTGNEYVDEESPFYNENNGNKERLYIKKWFKLIC
ncbi:hypothetical protein CHU92_01980 [Flavobacterium cyanobacteriorum]|uniref:histidine kinase n=1 Tax=Flavobacterium cyanobacteriorum TaxID=2022802 RepID=A0A255ZVI3_9FLAO|nr:response regulator [Flavobacterium cyanobacteriorum]OYQ45493.1 hypothetical protein CHU92_01980 [Flavobacterium cyanobacteriorum]